MTIRGPFLAAGSMLVEVMLGLLILLAAAGSLVHYRIGLQRQEEGLEQQASAWRLLADKTEDLRGFVVLHHSSDHPSYEDIHSQQGGLLVAGSYPGIAGPMILDWQVNDLPALPGWDLPAGKEVQIQVSWSANGKDRRVQQAILLVPLTPEP